MRDRLVSLSSSSCLQRALVSSSFDVAQVANVVGSLSVQKVPLTIRPLYLEVNMQNVFEQCDPYFKADYLKRVFRGKKEMIFSHLSANVLLNVLILFFLYLCY